MSIVTYRYGARVLAEHQCPDALGDQLVRRTRYWNALVESEQAFRARIDELVARHITGETEEEQRASRKLIQSRHISSSHHASL